MKFQEAYTRVGEFYLRHKNWLVPIAFLGLAAASALLGETRPVQAQTACGDDWQFTGMVDLAGGVRALAAEVPAHSGPMEVFYNLGCVISQARQAGARLPDEAFAKMLAGFTDFRQAANAIIASDGSLFLKPNGEALRLLFPFSDPAAAEADVFSGVRPAPAVKIMGFAAEALSSPLTPLALAGAAITVGILALWKLDVYHPGRVSSNLSRGGPSHHGIFNPVVNQAARIRRQDSQQAQLVSALSHSQIPGISYALMTGDYDTGLEIEKQRRIFLMRKAFQTLMDTLANIQP